MINEQGSNLAKEYMYVTMIVKPKLVGDDVIWY